MAEFRCGECAVCKPEPCRKCPDCKGRMPGRCKELVSARRKECLNYAALKAEHDAAAKKRHIEFTPIFAHWLCNDCNAQLRSLLDVLPASQIAPYLLRLYVMGRTVQGGITAGEEPAAPESDGYDASLEAMFD